MTLRSVGFWWPCSSVVSRLRRATGSGQRRLVENCPKPSRPPWKPSRSFSATGLGRRPGFRSSPHISRCLEATIWCGTTKMDTMGSIKTTMAGDKITRVKKSPYGFNVFKSQDALPFSFLLWCPSPDNWSLWWRRIEDFRLLPHADPPNRSLRTTSPWMPCTSYIYKQKVKINTNNNDNNSNKKKRID